MGCALVRGHYEAGWDTQANRVQLTSQLKQVTYVPYGRRYNHKIIVLMSIRWAAKSRLLIQKRSGNVPAIVHEFLEHGHTQGFVLLARTAD